MTITPKGRLLFSVTSVGRRNSLNTYTVDMEENKGLGACSCEHYDYRLRQSKGRCKHMSQCLRALGKNVLKRLSWADTGALCDVYAKTKTMTFSFTEWLGEAVVARHCGITRDKLYGKKG